MKKAGLISGISILICLTIILYFGMAAAAAEHSKVL